jgi:hypothetical protein
MFYGVDQRTEEYYKWSPYNYSKNNPVRFVDPDGKGIFDKIINVGKQYLVKKVAETTKAVITASANMVKDEIERMETGVKLEGEVKIVTGMEVAAKSEGVGGRLNIGTEDLVNFNGSMESTSTDEDVNFSGEAYLKFSSNDKRTTRGASGALTVATPIGLVGAEGKYESIETNKKNGNKTNIKTASSYIGIGWNGAVGGGLYTNQSNEIGRNSTEIGARIGSSGTRSAGIGISYDISLKFFLKYGDE